MTDDDKPTTPDGCPPGYIRQGGLSFGHQGPRPGTGQMELATL